MSEEIKYPKSGSVAYLRKLYLQLRSQKLTPEQRKKFEELLKNNSDSPKKVAKKNEETSL